MNKSVILLSIFLYAGGTLFGQSSNAKEQLNKALNLQQKYKFTEALDIYKQTLKESPDSATVKQILIRIAQCENGVSMMEYATSPEGMGSAKVSKPDFYKYLGSQGDRKWRILPEALVKQSKSLGLPNLALLANDDGEIYFSAPGPNGDMDIFVIKAIDGSNWSAPARLGDNINSPGNELLPYLSADKSKLYFTSDGHYGIGGLDLYVCEADPKSGEWGVPQNLGIPFSSPHDDIMFINSYDGKYSYLVSTREGSADSVTIYRMAYENMPIKSPLNSSEDALSISLFGNYSKIETKDSTLSKSQEDTTSTPLKTTPEADHYTKLAQRVRAIQKEIDSTKKAIEDNRKLFNTLNNPDDKALLTKTITEGELSLVSLNTNLRMASKDIQTLEMEFLSKGMIIPRDKLFEDKEQSASVEAPIAEPFVPKATEPARFPQITIMAPVEIFDYAFEIGDEARIAPDSELPQGLVYRIQLFLVSQKASSRQLRGISPIFETKTATGKYLYYAGQFYNYNEASAALNKVKRAGIPGAILKAFKDSRSISLSSAKAFEKESEAATNYQVRLDSYPEAIPEAILELIRKSSDKDIAKKSANGKNIFFIGPFSNKQEADLLKSILEEAGVEEVNVESIKTE